MQHVLRAVGVIGGSWKKYIGVYNPITKWLLNQVCMCIFIHMQLSDI